MYLCSCMHTTTILCSAADAVRSANCLILFKFVTFTVDMQTMLLHLSNFGLSLDLRSVADFSNTGARAKCGPFFNAREVWCSLELQLKSRGIEIFCELFFSINIRYPYRWVQVVSWLNYLILTVDLGSFFFPSSISWRTPLTCLWIYPCCFPWFLLMYVCVARIIFFTVRDCYWRHTCPMLRL